MQRQPRDNQKPDVQRGSGVYELRLSLVRRGDESQAADTVLFTVAADLWENGRFAASVSNPHLPNEESVFNVVYMVLKLLRKRHGGATRRPSTTDEGVGQRQP